MIKILLFCLFLWSSAQAADEIRAIDSDTTWEHVAKEYKSYDLLPFRSVDDYKIELMQWNKHITTAGPKMGDQIYITPPYSPYLISKHIPPLGKVPFFSRSFNLIVSYSASYAQNSETLPNDIAVDYKLNSPATVGLIARNILNSKNSLSYSLYGSYTTSSSVQGFDKTTVDPPLEIGATMYHEFAIPQMKGFNLYYGADAERFSSVDDEKIVLNELQFISNHVVFGTVGASVYLEKYFLKLSASYSLYSQSEKGQAYSGYKGIFFLGRMLSHNLTASTFAKYHQLDAGSKSMSGMRLGLGLGYRFY